MSHHAWRSSTVPLSMICGSFTVRRCRTALSHLDITANLDAVRAGVVDETSVIAALSRLATIYIYMGCGFLSSSTALHMHAVQDARAPAPVSTVPWQGHTNRLKSHQSVWLLMIAYKCCPYKCCPLRLLPAEAVTWLRLVIRQPQSRF